VQTLEVEYKKTEALGAPVATDGPTLIEGPCTLTRDGKVFAVVDYPQRCVSSLEKALLSIKMNDGHRTNGLHTVTKAFGYSPRNVIRGDWCRVFGLYNENRGAHDELIRWANVVTRLYEHWAPDKYRDHKADVQSRFDSHYLLSGGPFTSGNVNKNNALAYHYDKGNTKGAWSAMIVVKRGVSGGELVFPDYRARLSFRPGAVFLFNGQEHLHGVTRCVQTAPVSYRFSVVYYTSEQVWKCLPPKEELTRIQKARTERERARQHVDIYAGAKPELTALSKARNKSSETIGQTLRRKKQG
jgi:hypothetical protein